MNIEQAIQKEIMLSVMKCEHSDWKYNLNDGNIDEAYESLIESEEHYDEENEFRSSGEETGIKCDGGRHYEAKSVARKLSSGQWVGWVYYYGGGKHGYPGEVEWMNEAYLLEVEEKEVTIIKREIKKVGE